MGINNFAGFTMVYTWLPLVIVTLLIGGFMLRKKLGGFMEFKEALQYVLLAYLIYEIIYAITTYLLYVVIDRDLTQKLLKVSFEKMAAWMKSMGANDAKLTEAIEKTKNETTDLKKILGGMGWAMLINFLKSLAVAFVIKKENKQVFNN
jgi:hypothetical protein